MHHSSMSWEITLLYFFSWNFTWFLQKEPIKVQNFRKISSSGKISPNLYFDRLLLLKVYKISAKKLQRNYVSWYWRLMQNLKKNRFVLLKVTGIWWIFIRPLESLQNLHFHWSLSCKIYNLWPKKVQRSYLSWHWIFM